MFTHEDVKLAAYHNYLYRRRNGANEISTKEEEMDDWVNAINSLTHMEELHVWYNPHIGVKDAGSSS